MMFNGTQTEWYNVSNVVDSLNTSGVVGAEINFENFTLHYEHLSEEGHFGMEIDLPIENVKPVLDNAASQ